MIPCFHTVALTGLLAALLLPAGLAHGRGPDSLPTPFGARFYAADVPAAEPLPPRLGTPEADDWERRIREAEFANGPYGDGIAETLMDAANYFASRGDYSNAISYWRRSVHLVRVNEGLYSPLQLPALNQQLETYLRLGDWESAGEVKSYLYFLARKRYADDAPARLAASLDWYEWQRKQWLRDPNPEKPALLMSLWRELGRRTQEDDDQRLALEELESLTHAQLNLLYVVGTTDFGIDREIEMMLGRGAASAEAALDIDRAQAQSLQDAAYGRGRARLELLLERAAEAGDVMMQARANRSLGDWYQWNGSSRRAAAHYRESWRQLSELGERDLQREWYSAPVELPAGNILWLPTSPLEPDNSVPLVASFRVDARGRPRDVEARPLDPARTAQAIRLTRLLRDSRFRPRLVDGEMVDTEGLVREYRVPWGG